MMRAVRVWVAFAAGIAASPIALPQGVTDAIAPSGTPSASCVSSFAGVFGIAVMNISQPLARDAAKRQVSASASAPVPIFTLAEVSQIGDGQVQGGMHTVTLAPVSQIGDGQIQNPLRTTVPPSRSPAAIPAATATTTVMHGACKAMPRPTASSAAESDVLAASTSTPTTPTTTPSAASTTQPASSPTVSLVSCLQNSTLQLMLADGVLLDSRGRTGYIASNYQFQFDAPAQAGALYTSGWSICPGPRPDGTQSLALGASTTFYQCRSGSFYNLYTENWAAQCSPVELKIVALVSC